MLILVIMIKIKNMCFLLKASMFKFRGGGVCTHSRTLEVKMVHLISNGYIISISQYDGDDWNKNTF